MDRGQIISHLKAMIASEQRLARQSRPYLDKYTARQAEQLHWTNAQALALAVDELEAIGRGKGETPPQDCPEPVRELDEYVCTKCRIRWDTKEEKPACRK